MAMTSHSEPVEMLTRPLARAAGVVCLLLALAGSALAVLAVVYVGLSAQAAAGLIVLAAVLASLAVAAGYLLANRPWAQRVLLIAWLGGAAGSAATALALILWGRPEDWSLPVGPELLAMGALAASSVASGLLVAASVAGSRLRYGSLVVVAIAAAAVLTVVVNLITQKDPIRRDLQSLRMWGISDRTKTILGKIDQPVRISCVYTPGGKQQKEEDKRLLEERRDRVWELLTELHEQNRNIDVYNLTSDLEKAQLLERLRRQLGGKADQHAAVLQDFLKAAKDLLFALSAEQKGDWASLPEGSYLTQWGWHAEIAKVFRGASEGLQSAASIVLRDTQEGLPDYAKLTDEVKGSLQDVQNGLENVRSILTKVQKLPKAVQEGQKKVLASLDEAIAATEAMVKSVGAPTESLPSDAGAALKQVADAAGKAGEKISAAAQALENVAGADSAVLILTHRAFLKDVMGEQGAMSVSYPQILSSYAQQIEMNIRRSAQGYATAANAEYQKQFLAQLRKNDGLKDLLARLRQDRQSIQQALQILTKVDDASQKILQAAAGGTMFQTVLRPVEELLKRLNQLPPLEGVSLSADVMQDNIVIVEIDRKKEDGKEGEQVARKEEKKVEVVGFDEVWPQRAPAGPNASAEEDQKRYFNGDSAIATKLLKMTHEPFARVVVAYLESNPALARWALTAANARTLQKRLEDADFQVVLWELSKDMPSEEESAQTQPQSAPSSQPATARAGRKFPPTVLLVLPPPPTIPPSPYSAGAASFTREHMKKVADQIDRGTPAIFLVGNDFETVLGGLSSAYPVVNEYLQRAWGIDARTSYRLIATRRDAADPDNYRVDLSRFMHLPLSSFTDQPIGRPLQGQRLLWANLCPIVIGGSPAGVKAQPVMVVPKYMNDVWATPQMQALIENVVNTNEGIINPQKGVDMLPPFPVAVAATRGGERPVRIAVLAFAPSLRDGYLDERVPEDVGALKFADPPRADADPVINSVYWMVGEDDLIAAGPVQVKPIAPVESLMPAIKWLFVAGLPLLVLGIGASVLVARRS